MVELGEHRRAAGERERAEFQPAYREIGEQRGDDDRLAVGVMGALAFVHGRSPPSTWL
jgi:hypothetical protein